MHKDSRPYKFTGLQSRSLRSSCVRLCREQWIIIKNQYRLILVTFSSFSHFLKADYIEDITRWREDMNFMFEWQEHKIHIFEPMCNVLFIIWRLNIEYFRFYCVSKSSSFTNTAGLHSKQKILKYLVPSKIETLNPIRQNSVS